MSTSQGRPYAIFRRAFERKNLLIAEATARELPPLNLTDALDLTMLIAQKDPRRHPRVAARWLLCYLEECEEATIDEAAMPAPPGRGDDTSGHGRKSGKSTADSRRSLSLGRVALQRPGVRLAARPLCLTAH
jgi:hypothetical protein